MRKYDLKFKEYALSQSDKLGSKQAAEKLKVPYSTIIRWRSEREYDLQHKTPDVTPEKTAKPEKERHGDLREALLTIVELYKMRDVLHRGR